jgi:hypothetical protein
MQSHVRMRPKWHRTSLPVRGAADPTSLYHAAGSSLFMGMQRLSFLITRRDAACACSGNTDDVLIMVISLNCSAEVIYSGD